MDTGILSEPAHEASEATSSCFACESTDVEPSGTFSDYHASTGARYSLTVCRTCGSARLRESLTDLELERIYPPTFYSYDVSTSRNPLVAAIDRLRYDRHRFKPAFSRLLEIGSGCGEFLLTIADRGQVVGLERSPAARAKAAALGIDVRVGDVAEADLFPAAAFDYAYLSHSFEHLTNPAAALRSLRHWLDDEGRLFIAVPNFAGLLPTYFRKSWYNLALPLHVSQLTPAGITALLEHNGFIVERIAFNSDPLSIPMTLFFATKAAIPNMNRPLRYALMAAAMLCIPIVRVLDRLGRGDCMEVHARKRQST